MAITTSGTTLTFNDTTTQTTAPVNTNANVNSVSAGTGISVSATTGALTVTNAGVTSVTAGTGISLSGSTGAVTISSSGGAGTVTSVATGNGLSGGTITTSGTLTVACPTFNTVGSYCMGMFLRNGGSTASAGTNYAVGSGANQVNLMCFVSSSPNDWTGGAWNIQNSAGISGTWKWMANSASPDYAFGIMCRVS
jgi:hypothetical protein